MPSPEEEEVSTLDTTSPPRVIQPESSCLPLHHLVFLERPRAADIPFGDVHVESALSSPPSLAFTSTTTPPTESLLSTAPPSISSNLPTAPLDRIISQYFQAKVPPGSPKRIQHLVQAAKGFWDAARLHRCASSSTILSMIGTTFFYSIHIAHHVGLREKVVETSSRGVRRLALALKKTAEDLSLELPTVQIQYREGRRCLELILLGGPGSLLLTGRRVSILWRRRLGTGDVQLLLDYRARHIPHHDAKAAELNPAASRALIEYMVANGWCYEKLVSIQSELMCCLRRHIDHRQLVREEKGGFASTDTLTQPGEHSGNLSLDYRTSEGVSEDQALRELLEAAEQRDITEFMKPFQEDGQLNTWVRDAFPTMTQPINEPEMHIETFHQDSHINPWMIDIPVIQQDHPRGSSPHHLVAGFDSHNWVDNHIDAVASGHTREHDWLQQCGDTSSGEPPDDALGWYLEANLPFETPP